jgi:hypothetical protein
MIPKIDNKKSQFQYTGSITSDTKKLEQITSLK